MIYAFIAGKIMDKIWDGLAGALGKIIAGVVGFVIEPIMAVFTEIMTAIMAAVTPLINIIAQFIADMIVQILLPLIEIFFLWWTRLLVIFLGVIMKIIAQIIGALAGAILNFSFLPADFLTKYPFIIETSDFMKTMGMALLGLFTAYFAIKSMFMYLGFESEEPWKIAARNGVGALLIYGSMDICKLFFQFYFLLQQTIFDAFGMGAGGITGDSFQKMCGEDLINSFEIVTLILQTIIFIMIIIKIISLAIKFIERQILLMVFVIFAPIVFATIVGKSTREYFVSWIKGFFGQFSIQAVQVTGICLLFVITEKSVNPVTAGVFKMENILVPLLVLGCISLMVQAQAVLQQLFGMAFGGNDFGMGTGGILGGVNAAKNMSSGIAQAASFVVKK